MRKLVLFIPMLACGEDDDGFTRTYGSNGDDTSDTADSGQDTDPPDTALDTGEATQIAYDSAGGGDDTFDSTWSRCEEVSAGQRWTFHAELRYAASDVSVELDLGTDGYEMWVLANQDEGEGLIWEVEVEPYSNRSCDEWIELLWTATGGADWSATYESLYTPP